MQRIFHLILLFFLTAGSFYGQTKSDSCNCPSSKYAGTKADTVFHLSTHKSIALCGYKNPDSKPATYSEFVLAVCGKSEIIGFWDALVICQLTVNQNHLVIEQVESLPTGSKFQFQDVIWTIEKLSFDKDVLIRTKEVNRTIKKYNSTQIQTVLAAFEKTKPGITDVKMKIVYQLFMATISGNKKARTYFNTFENKVGTLSGANAEAYTDLKKKLAAWDQPLPISI